MWLLHYTKAWKPAGEAIWMSYQFEEVNEFVGVFSGGEVHKVPWDPVAQTGTGLHRHLAVCVAERRALLHMYRYHVVIMKLLSVLTERTWV